MGIGKINGSDCNSLNQSITVYKNADFDKVLDKFIEDDNSSKFFQNFIDLEEVCSTFWDDEFLYSSLV